MHDHYRTVEEARAALYAEHPKALKLPALTALYSDEAFWNPDSKTVIMFFDMLYDHVDPHIYVREIAVKDLLYDGEFASQLIEDSQGYKLVERPDAHAAKRALDEVLDLLADTYKDEPGAIFDAVTMELRRADRHLALSGALVRELSTRWPIRTRPPGAES